jgi:uncharacterized sulfatase
MTSPETRTPNIVFIVLDTHRVDRLGCYGYQKATSPNIDAFAQGATVFERAVSPGQWTIPAHASMFSGEFPSTHMTVQSKDALSPQFVTLADRLKAGGYRTIGFCNNPLVGVVNNGFTRGFQTFYNYGGAVPTVPDQVTRERFAPLRKLWENYTQLLRRISYPIQNLIASSDKALQLSLYPFFVPLWTRYANFKGNTANSIRDTTKHLQRNPTGENTQPFFLFFNLMETHLPYNPPERFTKKFAPIVHTNPKARAFMKYYNTQARRWLLPMEEPHSDLEYQTLCEMYDAEVAYQDHLLADLFSELDKPAHRENTMIIIVADHGEMLGEHQIMGHGLGVYQELVHVPLIIRLPGQTTGKRIEPPVSTTHLFHTVLDAADINPIETAYSSEVDISGLSLLPLVEERGAPPARVVAEAYPPDNVITIMKKYQPEFLKSSHTEAMNWAIYENWEKMIRIEEVREMFYDLTADPLEGQPLTGECAEAQLKILGSELDNFLERSYSLRPEGWTRGSVKIDDEKTLQRMRSLGYIE